MTQPPKEERRPIVILRRAEQACAAVIIAVSLAAMAAHWLKELGRQDDVIGLEPTLPPIEYKVDVNSAPWTEFALLPGIGEILAKRIVASRETEGPFLDHSDLRRVRGIGPRTLERMSPYLLPMPEMETVAGP
jgi:competence protein ComEA